MAPLHLCTRVPARATQREHAATHLLPRHDPILSDAVLDQRVKALWDRHTALLAVVLQRGYGGRAHTCTRRVLVVSDCRYMQRHTHDNIRHHLQRSRQLFARRSRQVAPVVDPGQAHGHASPWSGGRGQRARCAAQERAALSRTGAPERHHTHAATACTAVRTKTCPPWRLLRCQDLVTPPVHANQATNTLPRRRQALTVVSSQKHWAANSRGLRCSVLETLAKPSP